MDKPMSWTFSCDRGRIQTYNLLIRSQMLYSVEPWSQKLLISECKGTTSFDKCKCFFCFFLLIYHFGVEDEVSNIDAKVKVLRWITISVSIKTDSRKWQLKN